MRTMARMETYFLQIAFWLTLVLGGLALVLTLSGLFSVLSYLVEQRTKEIGVRMALGATTRDVTRLVLSQSSGRSASVCWSAAAWPPALATLLLATPAAATIGEIVHVLDPVAYAASLYRRRGLPAGRLDSGLASRAPRSDADASPGIGPRRRPQEWRSSQRPSG